MSAPVQVGRETDAKTHVPPLRNGDRLTAEEFERRYDAMPELKKAELIEGVVYVGSPVRAEDHGEPHADLIGWLAPYRIATPGVRAGDNATLRLAPRNRPQPDAYLRITPESGGQARVDDDGYIVGAVELTAEIAASSASYDLHDKLETYQRNGVREYVVWRVEDEAVDWFALRSARYERLTPGTDGILRSEVFPGLWLDPAALVHGDMARVDEVARLGLASPEHAAFVNQLRQRAGQASAGSP
ncbi:MAG TPA: Uma2 family endonuclease [Gemmataceae bacterium]|jgi:Uma2 family endonuclease